MQQMQWNTSLIKQCEALLDEKMLRDEQVLNKINQDFGQLVLGQAEAVYEAKYLASLEKFLSFSNQHQLPITIRNQGLSESGQALSVSYGVVVDVHNLNHSLSWTENKTISVGCSVSWKKLIEFTLAKDMIPPVYPYNLNLSIGGVLSVGGLGSATFKQGIIGAHVLSLNVLLANGELIYCDKQTYPDLFLACLSGIGLFGIIYEAELALRLCERKVYSLTLQYDDLYKWIAEQRVLKNYCTYMEAFFYVPNGNINAASFRTIISIEANGKPDFYFLKQLSFVKEFDYQEQDITDYIMRHNPRIEHMQNSQLWSSYHPWYECYIDSDKLEKVWPDLLQVINFGVLGERYHIFPVEKIHPKYFMLPESDKIVTFNILTPGIAEKDIASAIQSLNDIDAILSKIGKKRYISGWFDKEKATHWSEHYEDIWEDRVACKRKYDPHGIFASQFISRLE